MTDCFPLELRLAICAYIHSSCIPSLDPLVVDHHGVPTSLPSSIPPAFWPESVARRTLAQLCLINRAWYDAAKPWLWYKLEVRLPRTFLSMVEEIAGDYDEETVDMVTENTIRPAAQAAFAQAAGQPTSPGEAQALEKRKLLSLSCPDESIPLELLSPVASRDPSPRRLRVRTKSKSPARWEIMRSFSDAVQTPLDLKDPGVYIPTPYDPRPGRFVRHLDFNHFRTLGMRRSIEEGVNSPFVTSHRVMAIVKKMPNLLVFGATEFMDGSLSLHVLNELLLRGAPLRGRGRPTRGRLFLNPHDSKEKDRERRRDCRELQALDLTGCISSVFVTALNAFAAAHLLPLDAVDQSADSPRMSLDEPLVLPGMRRLGMRGVKSVTSRTLTAFVLAFPFLTHLDLSGTRVNPELLAGLSASRTVRLQSLALARCTKLTGDSIADLLVKSLATSELKELNLYGDMTYASPLSEGNLVDLFTQAPCFLSGKLIYLDLSSAPMTRAVLAKTAPQPQLRSLGLSHIPTLELRAVADFLRTKAPQIEVLTLAGTSPDLDCSTHRDQAGIALHTHIIHALCTPPFSFSLSVPATETVPPPTRLRVVELSPAMLNALGAGARAWRIVRSKGGRGWYVDTACGWVSGALRRDLSKEHPWRRHLEQLSDANGNVSSGIGWHARKMEILYGHGMLGHEDGLYGAVSFAHQG